MSQVTIYLNSSTESKMRNAAKANNLSVSKWVSKVIQNNVATQWSQDAIDLAGSWNDDFPTLNEIRSNQAVDHKREEL